MSVSVVLPARNAERTLGRALDSALGQSIQPDEVLVVDDASADGTAAVAKSYAGRQVQLLTATMHGGAAAARNIGIRAAKGDWIAFLDADDVWHPAKLERQLAAVRRTPNTPFVFCASQEFAADGQALGDTFRNAPVTCSKDSWKALLISNFVATPTVLARRDLLLRLGGFDEVLKVAEDQDMWIRLAFEGVPAYVPESLVDVHVQPSSLSNWTFEDQTAYTLPMIKGHLERYGEWLTVAERRAIMGGRIGKIGQNACAHGDMRHGLWMILQSAFLGYQPLRSISLLVRVPLAAFFRRLLCGLRRHHRFA